MNENWLNTMQVTIENMSSINIDYDGGVNNGHTL